MCCIVFRFKKLLFMVFLLAYKGIIISVSSSGCQPDEIFCSPHMPLTTLEHCSVWSSTFTDLSQMDASNKRFNKMLVMTDIEFTIHFLSFRQIYISVSLINVAHTFFFLIQPHAKCPLCRNEIHRDNLLEGTPEELACDGEKKSNMEWTSSSKVKYTYANI